MKHPLPQKAVPVGPVSSACTTTMLQQLRGLQNPQSLANSPSFQSHFNTCPMHPKKSLHALQHVQLYQGHWHFPHSGGTADQQRLAGWVKYPKTSQTYHQPGKRCGNNLPHPQHDPGGLLLQFLLFFGKPCREGRRRREERGEQQASCITGDVCGVNHTCQSHGTAWC